MPDTLAPDVLEQFAEQLADAWMNREQIDSVPPVLLTDRQDGYRVQDLMARRIGSPVAGWKAGATSEGIVPGRVFVDGLFVGEEHTLDASNYPGGRLEPEFAFRFLQSPGLRTDWTGTALAPLVAPHIAVEIIGSRMVPALPVTCRSTAMTIADNGNAFALIIGSEIEAAASYDPLTHPVDLRADDGPAAANSTADIRAQPLDALADTVNLLAERGITLEAGQFLTTGSATDTLAVQAGSTVTANFGDLGTICITFA